MRTADKNARDTGYGPRWRLFVIVWLFSMMAWFLVLPFTVATLGDAITETGSLGSFILSTFVSNLILLGVTTLIGLFAARKVGLGLPLIESWLRRTLRWDQLMDTIRMALLAGAITGGLLILVDVAILTPYIESATGVPDANLLNPELDRASPGYGFLAAVSAGVTEEVLFRLGGVSVVAWLGSLFLKDANGRPKSAVLWAAVVAMGFLFGLAHLQTPSMLGWDLASATIMRILVLNGIGGLVYGWMFWKHGLESAIVTHFSTDVVLHVLVPLIILWAN